MIRKILKYSAVTLVVSLLVATLVPLLQLAGALVAAASLFVLLSTICIIVGTSMADTGGWQ